MKIILTAEEEEKCAAVAALISEDNRKRQERVAADGPDGNIGAPENLEILRQIIAIENIDAQDENGLTALHYKVAGNLGASVRVLLEEGADPEIASDSGITPIQLAAHLKYQNILEIFEAHNVPETNLDIQAGQIIQAATAPSTSVNATTTTTATQQNIRQQNY